MSRTIIVSTSGKKRNSSLLPITIFLSIALVGTGAYIIFTKNNCAESQRGSATVDSGAHVTEFVSNAKLAVNENENPSVWEEAPATTSNDGKQTNNAQVFFGGVDNRPTTNPNIETDEDVQAKPIATEKKIFDNRVEDLLLSISEPESKFGLMPESVNMPHEQVMEYLRKPVEIYEDDDEVTVAAKERTAAMKTAALKYIEDGGTFDQFVRDNVAYANEVHGILNDVRSEMKRILHDKGIEAAQAYLDEVNPQLKEQGISEVTIRKGDIILMERQKAKEAAEAKHL